MSGKWHGGKGDARRKGSDEAYRRGWDRVFKKGDKPKESEDIKHETSFAQFIREASETEQKSVYITVLDAACNRQQQISDQSAQDAARRKGEQG